MTSLKIDCTSDIHLDHYIHDPIGLAQFMSIFPGGDILLIAGDIASRHTGGIKKAKTFLNQMSKRYQYVIYVRGNHDFYEGKKAPPYADSRYCPDNPRVILLNRKSVEVLGLKISGCFAWYETGMPMNDIFQIQNAEDYSQVQKSLDMDFLEGLENTDILLTHTPLSPKFISPKFASSPHNHYYFHDREDLIKGQLYICGHTHEHSEFTINNTHCINHAAGYKGQINPRYTPRRFEFENSTLQLQVSQ